MSRVSAGTAPHSAGLVHTATLQHCRQLFSVSDDAVVIHLLLLPQALQLLETQWQPIGPDMLLTGYLPAATGLWGLQSGVVLPSDGHRSVAAPGEEAAPGLPQLSAATATDLLPKRMLRHPEEVRVRILRRGTLSAIK